MMGFAVSALIFGSLANAMFPIIGWEMVCYVIAVVGVIFLLALAIVVKPAPKDIGETLGLSGSALADKVSPTQKQPILKTKVFWLYSIWATIVIACGLTLIGTAAQGVAAADANMVAIAALLVGLVSTMNGLGRIINGAIFDRIGLVPVMVLAAILTIAASAGLALALALQIGPLFIVSAILIAFPYSAVPVMASAYARQRYEAASFGTNLGIANMNIASAAVINIIIVAVVGSPAAVATGPVVYGILAVLAVVAFLITFVFGKVYKADLAEIKKELDAE
jgi:OFA family oxalate/formate antiporter-like MFS transporter